MEVFYSIDHNKSNIVFCWEENGKTVGMLSCSRTIIDYSLWTVDFVRTIKPKFGPTLYNTAMNFITEKHDGWLTSSRENVSIKAINVWWYYFSERSDIIKEPITNPDIHNHRKGSDYCFLNWKYRLVNLKNNQEPKSVTRDSDQYKQAIEFFNHWKP